MKSYLNATQEEIVDKALELEDESLATFYGERAIQTVLDLAISPKNKGKLGNLVEVLHFGLELNNRPGPDFIAAGIELKTTGLKALQSGEVVAKERLPLGSINYMRYADPAEWDFDKGGILNKSRILLLMVYLYEKNVEIVDLIFKLIDLWEFPAADLEIIRQDWIVIIEKIRDGRAHELSEGDTFYLATSTAGAGHGRVQDQPFNKDQKAKPRKFSLKKPYLDHILAKLSGKVQKDYGRIIDDAQLLKKTKTFEDVVIEKFERFKGASIDQMIEDLNIVLKPGAKDWAARLTKAVLKISLDAQIEEFDKAGIIIKTIRLEPNNRPKQSISFPAFQYTSLIKETWEDSEFKRYLDSRFLLVFFQYDGPESDEKRKLIFQKALFWNMPDTDIDEAESVWKKTVEVVGQGRIVKDFETDRNGKVTRVTRFPGAKANPIAHTRPHATKHSPPRQLPTPDIYTGVTEYTPYCFWINGEYVRNIFLEN